MNKKIVILILLFIIGLSYSYNIIEGLETIDNSQYQDDMLILLGKVIGEDQKDNNNKISIDEFFNIFVDNTERCKALKKMVDLTITHINLHNLANSTNSFPVWAGIVSSVVCLDAGSRYILGKDTRVLNSCNISEYIDASIMQANTEQQQ